MSATESKGVYQLPNGMWGGCALIPEVDDYMII